MELDDSLSFPTDQDVRSNFDEEKWEEFSDQDKLALRVIYHSSHATKSLDSNMAQPEFMSCPPKISTMKNTMSESSNSSSVKKQSQKSETATSSVSVEEISRLKRDFEVVRSKLEMYKTSKDTLEEIGRIHDKINHYREKEKFLLDVQDLTKKKIKKKRSELKNSKDILEKIEIKISLENAFDMYVILMEKYARKLKKINIWWKDYYNRTEEMKNLLMEMENERIRVREELNKKLNDKLLQEMFNGMSKKNESKPTEQANFSKYVLQNLYDYCVALNDKVDKNRTIELQNAEKYEIPEELTEACELIYDRNADNELKDFGQLLQQRVRFIQKVAKDIEDSTEMSSNLMIKDNNNLCTNLEYLEKCIPVMEQKFNTDVRSHTQSDLDGLKNKLLKLKHNADETKEILMKNHEKSDLLTEQLRVMLQEINENYIIERGCDC